MRKILTLVLAAGLFAALPPTHSQQAQSSRNLKGVRAATEAVRPSRNPLLSPKQDGCVEHTIACGQTVTSRITNNDCKYTNTDISLDIWFFQGIAGQTITLTMSSNDFDPFLVLYDPDVNVVDFDDNSGGGLTARIVFPIDQTSPDWSLDATPNEDFDSGDYTLSLQCSGQPPPPPPPPPPPGPACPTGFFSDPNYPDFCFRVNIHNNAGVVPGVREPDCIDETVCVSGALPGRSEVFVRIIGPRPNGFLWPTIVRFTPSRVVAEIRQLSSGEQQTYDLPIVPPGVDDLSGLQDRTGFLP